MSDLCMQSPPHEDAETGCLSCLVVAEVRLHRLETRVKHYERAFMDIAREAGADVDFDDPDQLIFPAIEEYALGEVRELRELYEEALRGE